MFLFIHTCVDVHNSSRSSFAQFVPACVQRDGRRLATNTSGARHTAPDRCSLRLPVTYFLVTPKRKKSVHFFCTFSAVVSCVITARRMSGELWHNARTLPHPSRSVNDQAATTGCLSHTLRTRTDLSFYPPHSCLRYVPQLKPHRTQSTGRGD